MASGPMGVLSRISPDDRSENLCIPAKLLKTSKLRFVKAMPIDLSSVRIKSVSVYGIPEYTDCSLIVSTGLWGHKPVR